ncbi:MAG: hypothetical protein Q8936_11810 [Bacillota bacterium]|nr:hypothetical protein [Bacillota bacterium]
MSNKYTVKDKQLIRLGIRKNSEGDFEYIDPNEKNRSKYTSNFSRPQVEHSFTNKKGE